MTAPICIDRAKLITKLNHAMLDLASGNAQRANGINDAIDIVSRSYRVSHDIGVCNWTMSKDSEGMVHYETSCGSAESFFETWKGMEFAFCPFCGCKIVEEE